MKIEAEVMVEVLTPQTPNFLRVVRNGVDAGSVTVGELSNKQLRKVVDAWAEELYKKAYAQRSRKGEQ
jgi:hypothetical protein